MSHRFLFVQLADIGDLILTTPAIAALREAHPEAHLALLASDHSAPVIAGTGLVDELITFERKQFNSSKSLLHPANLRRVLELGAYDTVIYFHHFTLKLGTLKFALIGRATGAIRRVGLDNGNGWFLTDRLPDNGFGTKHQAQYWLDLVGLLGAATEPRPAHIASVPPQYRDQDTPRVIIHAGSGGYSLARRWSPERFAAVADALHDTHNADIVLVGTPDDDSAAVKAAMQHTPLDYSGQTTLPQLAGILQSADLFIGPDSGVMHMAAAADTPLVAIFGPSNHAAWGPWTPASPSIVLRSDPICSPCSYVGHGIGLRDGCAARTCMRMVTTEQVLDAAYKLLQDDEMTVHQRRTQHAGSLQPPKTSERIRILELPVDAITYEDWLVMIDRWVQERERLYHVCTVNPEFMMVAQNDPNFRHILQRADLCVPDGVGLLWAAKHRGTPLPERVTGSDGVPIIAERAAKRGWKLFFLGAAPGVAEQAAAILLEQHPDLQISGVYAGSPTAEEEDAIVERINASGADILFVAYGAPQQDKWIARNSPRLQVSMAMGVGGAFDFIAGVIPRAPQWMRNAGLEWLYRLYKQPWRIKRMLRLPRFVLAVLRERSR